MIAIAGWVDTDLAAAHRLTGRHIDVLTGIATGLTNASIATRLGIAEDTVKKYLKQVYQRLGVGDRASAVAVAYDGGVLRPRRDTAMPLRSVA